ncbi:MAG TPA: hypothetical protein VEI52_09580 [Terriglobales bacterium]|nr:hypothetical protein [Terriglobales bacterium]
MSTLVQEKETQPEARLFRIARFVVTGLLLLVFSTLAAAQQRKIYLDPDNGFSAYFSSALQKKKVPVTVTTDPKQADYTAQFQAKDSNGSVLKGVLNTLGAGNYDNGSFNQVVMTIVDAKSKDVVFSYTCKKSSQYMDASSSLATSVAECLAKHWEKALH